MTASPSERTRDAARIGALAEPLRLRLYDLVVASTEPVSREQAADALDLPAHTARFHLDRLVAEGLLDVEYRRLTGRTGPGAGRPAKLYRRSAREVAVSLPARRYQLVGRVLAAGVDAAVREGTPVAEAVTAAGHRAGVEAGAEASGRSFEDVLAADGYEPRTVEDEIELANCPFDRLARTHTALVCGVNLAYLSGVVEGLGDAGSVDVRLAPTEGRCCVRARRR